MKNTLPAGPADIWLEKLYHAFRREVEVRGLKGPTLDWAGADEWFAYRFLV